MISEADIRKVRDASDLVAIVSERVILRQKGRKFWGCCPFHNERTPSFQVDPGTQLFHCFGCGVGGDAIGYLMRLENMPFVDAVQTLALRAGIEIEDSNTQANGSKRNRLIELCDMTADFYHNQLMRAKNSEAQAARAYLSARDLNSEIANKWQLGYAPGHAALVKHLQKAGFSRKEMVDANVALDGASALRDRFFERVIFPIHDLSGHTIAFGGRIIKAGEPKYLNSSDTQLFHKRQNLFALDFAKERIVNSQLAIVVEGYVDVIAMHRAGFSNTVATLGTALTAQQVKLLARFTRKIVLLFDGDEAGRKAAFKAHELAGQILSSNSKSQQAEVQIALLPGGLDPADYLDQHPALDMQGIIDSSVPLLKFAIDSILEGINPANAEQRSSALSQSLVILKTVDAPLIIDDYLGYLATRLSVDVDIVRQAFSSTKLDGQRKREQEGKTPDQQAPSTADSASVIRIRSLEKQLFALYLQSEAIRPLLGRAFERIEFSDAANADIARTLLAADRQTEVPLMQYLYTNLADAGFLTEATADLQIADAERLANLLLWQLKIQQVEAQIKACEVRIRGLEQTGGAEYDKLFTEIVKLQQDLSQAHKKYSKLEGSDNERSV